MEKMTEAEAILAVHEDNKAIGKSVLRYILMFLLFAVIIIPVGLWILQMGASFAFAFIMSSGKIDFGGIFRGFLLVCVIIGIIFNFKRKRG